MSVKNNIAAMLIGKYLCGVTYVLEEGNLNSLEGTDLHTCLIGPLARFMEKYCIPSNDEKAELVASDILGKNIATFKKNFRDKVWKHGCWNNNFCLRILNDHNFTHSFQDKDISKGAQVEYVYFSSATKQMPTLGTRRTSETSTLQSA